MLIHLEKLGKSFGEKVVLHDVSASVEKEDRIGIVGQNGAGKTTLLKILTGVYTDYDGEFSVTHGVTLGYLEQNAKLDTTLDIYGEMRSSFAPVLDAMAQMQILEKKMAASPDDAALLEKHDELQNIIDAADGYNMDVNIKKVLSGMGFAQDTWSKNVGVLSGGELTRLRLAKLLLEKPDVLILDEPTNHLDFATMEWLENYLKGYSGAVLVVSHDRYFLDNVVDRIFEFDGNGNLLQYEGGYTDYLEAKERRFGKLPEKAAQTAMAKTAASAAGTGKKDTGTATDAASGKEITYGETTRGVGQRDSKKKQRSNTKIFFGCYCRWRGRKKNINCSGILGVNKIFFFFFLNQHTSLHVFHCYPNYEQ